MSIERAASFLQSHQTFFLAAHQSPDGDTLGSCLALRQALRHMDKQATVVCSDPVPEWFSFLVGADTVLAPAALQGLAPAEAVVYVDCADHKRTGELQPLLEAAPFQYCIDHHETNPQKTKDGDWVEPTGATGELILQLLQALSVPLTKEIATCLYTALATDTGNFSYSNTTPDTFRAAALLLEAGIDLPELNRTLFRSMKRNKARLIAYVLQNMHLYEQDMLGIVTIELRTLDAFDATEADCEGLIDYVRDINTVEAACVLRESHDGTVRVSMRSKHGCDVAKPAQQFGGGGHFRAAGCTLHTTLDEAERQVRAALVEAIRTWKAS